eukprot:TRINITY_DN3066_c0_g1_i1.p1 TRINITY_DN3066_c0_g1~~TRINITY_DN3066_c0_g1_i1.p1  ORF type:complete len:438 (+),score=86.43 TRINITY_DN3066_c0_g1_i1:131-1444(+)
MGRSDIPSSSGSPARSVPSRQRDDSQSFDWAAPLPFSLKELKSAVPNHCFTKSYVRPLLWLLHDLSLYGLCMAFGWCVMLGHGLPASVTGASFVNAAAALLSPWLNNFIGWVVFAAVTGTVGTGLWVLAHEAGHHALTPSHTLNNFIGYVVHQWLLVPYFAWQYSHGVHHRRTNHLDDGETHVPSTIDDVVGDSTLQYRMWMYQHLPQWLNLGALTTIFLIVGWPVYVVFHTTGSAARRLAGANHFDWSDKNPLFPSTWRSRVRLSSLGVICMVLAVATSMYYLGVMTVMKMYVCPLLITNCWLIGYTFVHHTHERLPHMQEGAWDWLKGALCTVDCDYGAVFDYIHHDIGRTHLAHHLFSEMPFHHQREATVAIRSFLDSKGVGHLYTFNPTPFRTLVRGQVDLFYAAGDGPVRHMCSIEDAARDIAARKGTVKAA